MLMDCRKFFIFIKYYYSAVFCFIILVANVNASSKKGNPPSVVATDATSITAYVGETHSLVCRVSGKPIPLTTWWKDEKRIGNEWKRFKIGRKSLRIRDVHVSDSGTYHCEAVNGFGKKNVEIHFNVKGKKKGQRFQKSEKPIFTQPKKMRHHSIVQLYGKTVRLKCKARGRPTPEIEWYKNDNLTTIGYDMNRTKPQWTLRLRNLQPQHSGRYTCRVWNYAGEITFDYTLQVVGDIRERPVLLSPHPINTTVTVGDKTSIQCQVYSPVPPTIKWIKRIDQRHNGHPMDKWPDNQFVSAENSFVVLPTQEMKRLRDGSYLNKLVIKHVSVRDGGMYYCFGVNTMGYNFRYAYLTVLPRNSVLTKEDSFPISAEKSLSLPIIIGIPAGLSLMVVFSLTIYCVCKRDRLNPLTGFLGNATGVSRIGQIKATCSSEESHNTECVINHETFPKDKDSSSTCVYSYTADGFLSMPQQLVPLRSSYGDFNVRVSDSTEDVESLCALSSSTCFHPPPPPPSTQYSGNTSSCAISGKNRKIHHSKNCLRNHRCRHAYLTHKSRASRHANS